jgi:hypothetical protein
MSVYRSARSPFWHFDFWVRGHRFFGSTKATTRREAEAVERTERERAKQHVAQLQASRTSLRLDDVAGRYWQEVGQHHVGDGARNTWRELSRLIEFFGKDKLLTEINGDDMVKLVAWRRGHHIRGQLISPFTVNATTKQVRKLFTRAKIWGVRFDHEPRWRQYWLKEPHERVRELAAHEAAQLDAAMRDDLAPFFAFARRRACGCASACYAGRKWIGVRARFAKRARAASLSPCRSRRRSGKSSGRCAGIIPSTFSPSSLTARSMAASKDSAIRLRTRAPVARGGSYASALG